MTQVTVSQHKKVKFITLGCRVNQYDTQGMREILQNAGMKSFGKDNKIESEKVDYVVINTCTVTEDADKTNRYWIRRARRNYPDAKIIVTGCGVEKNQDGISAMKEVDLTLLNHEKADIASRLNLGCATSEYQKLANSRREFTPLSISHSEGKTRAFVKIQDGCNHACSFCKVVLVRGRSRSRNLGLVIDEVKRLRDGGYKEIVFAGIQLGAYGEEWQKRELLSELLAETQKVEGVERIRLSSIEPTDVSEELIQTMKSLSKCAHHLHIPLQSGDDEILKKMNRRYNREFYRQLIAQLRHAMPDFNLTMDVMAGFPGETEDHFNHTKELIHEVEPLRCHVFPYSARRGTRAFDFQDIPITVKRERVRQLMELSVRMGKKVCERYLGQEFEILVENDNREGLTQNFMKVVFETKRIRVGEIIKVRLNEFVDELFYASLME